MGGDGAPSDSVISASPFIKMLRQAAKTKAIAGVVLRVDSGGGDALASDLMYVRVAMTIRHPTVCQSLVMLFHLLWQQQHSTLCWSC